MAADMVQIIREDDIRPLFLFASLLVVHDMIQAPTELLAVYEKAMPGWCADKQKLAAMSSTADNATAQVFSALKEQRMWNNTILVIALPL